VKKQKYVIQNNKTTQQTKTKRTLDRSNRYVRYSLNFVLGVDEKLMIIKQAFNTGRLTEEEAERLGTQMERCPKCSRLVTRNEIEDMAMCVHCDHIQQDVFDAQDDEIRSDLELYGQVI